MTLGLSTGQALAKLRDQLSSLLEQHQRVARRQASVQVYIHADTDQRVGAEKIHSKTVMGSHECQRL